MFITNPDKVIKQNLQDNTKIMGEIDHSLQKIGGQSLIVHGMIRDKLDQGFKEIEKKNQHSFTNELSKQYTAVNKSTMDSDLKKIFADIYTKDEIEGLTTQNENLNTIKSNINILINKNQAIQALKPLQRQINTIQEAIPKSYFEKIQNFFSKINNVFKENSKKALPHLIIQNNKKLYDITEDLKVAEAKISRSHQLRRDKLDHQLRKLSSEKMDSKKRDALNALLTQVGELDDKCTAAALGIKHTEPGQPNISEGLNILNTNKPISLASSPAEPLLSNPGKTEPLSPDSTIQKLEGRLQTYTGSKSTTMHYSNGILIHHHDTGEKTINIPGNITITHYPYPEGGTLIQTNEIEINREDNGLTKMTLLNEDRTSILNDSTHPEQFEKGDTLVTRHENGSIKISHLNGREQALDTYGLITLRTEGNLHITNGLDGIQLFKTHMTLPTL